MNGARRLALVVFAVAAGLLPAAHSSAAQRSLSWHNTGDSYSSGEGVGDRQGNCSQSDNAYGPLAVRLAGKKLSIGKHVFTACTGYLAEDFDNTIGDHSSLAARARASGLSDDRSDVLTLSFGGNDLGFAKILQDCVGIELRDLAQWVMPRGADCDVTEQDLMMRVATMAEPTMQCKGHRQKQRTNWGCDLLIDEYVTSTTTDATVDDLRGSISDFYAHLVDRHLTPTGRLYIEGYPMLFAPLREWSAATDKCRGIRSEDSAMLNRVTTQFDQTLRAAADKADAGTNRITYISQC